MGWGFKEDDHIFTFDLHILKMWRWFRRGALLILGHKMIP